MISYTAECEDPGVVQKFRFATQFIDLIPNDKRLVHLLRCHEVARAVGRIVHLPVQDGDYGVGVEHSWLWFENGDVLDVYATGRLPIVQYVRARHPFRAHRDLYHGGPPRTDIAEDVVEALVHAGCGVPVDVGAFVALVQAATKRRIDAQARAHTAAAERAMFQIAVAGALEEP